jgi:hypothetical protein
MVAPLITSKKVRLFPHDLIEKNDFRSFHQTVSNIQKWNQVQEELKDGPNAHAPVCRCIIIREHAADPSGYTG